MVKKPKAKGNKFENDVLRQCRKIAPESYKTLGSGNSKDDKGDIVFKNWLIECKHMKDLTDGDLCKFFAKVSHEASQREDFHPLLVFKKNRRRTMVMFRFLNIEDAHPAFMYWDDFLEHIEGIQNEN
jgi:hypothetical protein